jgi:DNA polymerase (family 10)
MDRLEAARVLHEIGRRLRIGGGNPFRARAFERAALALQSQPVPLATLVEEGRLEEVRGVGKALASVLEELHRTGRSRLLDRLRSEMPEGVLELSRLGLLGLARIRRLQDAIGVTSLASLETACREGRVRQVRGFGPRTEARLIEAIARLREGEGRVHLHRSTLVAEELVRFLLESPAVEEATAAGEVRRRCETVSSLPLVATGAAPSAVAERLLSFPLVETTVGLDSPTVILTNGLPVRLQWSSRASYGAELVRATGSAEHVAQLERHARTRGMATGLSGVLAADEASFYSRLGLPFIPPELREGAGEVEAAAEGRLPRELVTAPDLRGFVHCHTNYSDGRDSVLQMAMAARRLGAAYLTITDHSPTAAYAGGVEEERLERQWDEIQAAQEITGLRILRGTESDILADGSLDYPDRVLDRLDIVIASIHNRYAMDSAAMTRRITRALALPVFKVWGHARGRLINRRPPFDCRMEEILDVAAASRVAIEVNGDPYRLDLDPVWIRAAKARGLRFVVSVDAHSTEDLRNVRYGIDMARRGWLERSDVLNTRDAEAFAASVRPAG